jgi:hypothetical protein
VGVGVGVLVGVLVTVGVCVGVLGKLQSKYALKSKSLQFIGGDGGGGHKPLLNKFADISGHVDKHG